MIYPTPLDIARPLQGNVRPHDASKGYSLRHDVWEDAGGTVRALLLQSKHATCLCVLLARDPVTLMWSEGRARFPAQAFEAPRDAFFGVVGMAPVKQGMLPVLGVFTGQAAFLCEHVERAVQCIGPRGVDQDLPPASRGEADPFEGFIQQMEARTTLWHAVEGGTAQYVGMATVEGFLFGRALHAVPSALPSYAPDQSGLGHVFTLTQGAYVFEDTTAEIPGYAMPHVTRGRLSTFLKPFCAALSERMWPQAMRFVLPGHWTAEIHAHYMAPGERGAFRRQAGGLYPFLAEVLALEEGLVALVDAGRPYEERLAEVLNCTLRPNVPKGITRAKVRRLRGVRREMTPDGLDAFLDLAANLPLDRVDALRDEWKPATGQDILRLTDWARDLGLDMADLLRRVRRLKEGEWMSALAGARDMVDRFDATLILPCLEGGPFVGSSRTVAARILFGGRDLDAVARLSAEWHGNLLRFENALPEGRDLVSWPALFEPFEEGDVVVRCLTRPSELRAEGGFGDEGLAHCAAGYAQACYAGATHLASISVRREGSLVRLSTAEMKVYSPHSPEPRISAIQHKGRRNAQPSIEACRGLVSFYKAVEAGKVVLNRNAFQWRSGAGWDDGIDWSAMESRKAAMVAWRPSLGRDARVSDPEVFARMVVDLAGRLASPTRD